MILRVTDPLPRPLPKRLPCLPFRQPYGAMAVRGVKTLETRGTDPRWPYVGEVGYCEPGWLAVYNGSRLHPLQPEVLALRQRSAAMQELLAPYVGLNASAGEAGAVIGLLWIGGTRELVRGDLDRAFFWEEGRRAWRIDHCLEFTVPLTREQVGLSVAPQSLVYLDGAVVGQHLWAMADCCCPELCLVHPPLGLRGTG